MSTKAPSSQLLAVKLDTTQQMLIRVYRKQFYSVGSRKIIRAFTENKLQQEEARKFRQLAYFVAADTNLALMRTGENVSRERLKSVTSQLAKLNSSLGKILGNDESQKLTMSAMYANSLPPKYVLSAVDLDWAKASINAGDPDEGLFIDRIRSLWYATGKMLANNPSAHFLHNSKSKKGPSGNHFIEIERAVALWGSLWQLAFNKKPSISVTFSSDANLSTTDPSYNSTGPFVVFAQAMLEPFKGIKFERKIKPSASKELWTRQIRNGLKLLDQHDQKKNSENMLISYLGLWRSFGPEPSALTNVSDAQEETDEPQNEVTSSR